MNKKNRLNLKQFYFVNNAALERRSDVPSKILQKKTKRRTKLQKQTFLQPKASHKTDFKITFMSVKDIVLVLMSSDN